MENENKKNNKAVLIAIIVLLVIIALLCCYYYKNKNRFEMTTNVNQNIKSPYEIKSNSLEDFDIRFLQLENNMHNKVYSPLSIKYALAMLNEGTDGESNKQIKSVIGNYISNKYINSKNMSFANAMYIKDILKDRVKDSYINNLKNKYDAEVIYDSFKSANNINSWVNDKTLGLIKDIVNNADLNDLDFALINALAIDMEWEKLIQADIDHYQDEYSVHYNHENYSEAIPFLGERDYYKLKFNNTKDVSALEIGASINNYDIIKTLGEDNIRKEITREYNKWLADDECNCSENPEICKDTTTFVDNFIKELKENYHQLDSSTDFKYYIDDDVKVFAKDLKEYNGTKLQYIGIMPTKKALNNYIDDLNASKIKDLINNLKDIKNENFEEGYVTKITGYIPIFNYSYELDLINDLKDMGIEDIFLENKANLSNIINDNYYISKAVHKANIDFSNEGIKAAAVTLFGGRGAVDCYFEHLYEVPLKEIDLTFDKPYMYLIRDVKTGEVWFVGTVYEPSIWTEMELDN